MSRCLCGDDGRCAVEGTEIRDERGKVRGGSSSSWEGASASLFLVSGSIARVGRWG